MPADQPNAGQVDLHAKLTNTLSLLQATLESAPYGIVVIDGTGRIVAHNTRFATLWSIPADLLANGNIPALAHHCAQQVRDPAHFLQLVHERLARTHVETRDEIELTNGRIFERHSYPQQIAGEGTGLVLNLHDITARKRNEAALQKQGQLIATLIRDLPGMVYRCANDPSWTMLFVSAGCGELTGYEPGEMEGNRLVAYADLVHPDDRDWLWAKCQTSLEARTPCENEYRIVDRAGKIRWVHERAAGDYGPDGKLIAIDGFIQDVTARKAVDAALAQSVRALAEAQRIGNLGSWSLDVATNQVVWSEELYRMYGFDPSQPVPPYTESAKLFTPESWQRLSTAIAHCRETGTAYELELETVRPDGRRGWMLARGESLRDERGTTVEIHGVAQDITARKAAEHALRSSEEHLNSLMHSVDGIVWEADASTFQFTFVSPRAERLLGYPLSRWITEPSFWADHIHPEDRDTAVRYCVSCTQANRDHEFEYRMLAADGRTIWLRDIVSLVLENGQAVKLRGLMVDISARKAAESERDRLFNLSTDLICVANYQGYFTQVNPAWTHTLGWTATEMTSRPWLEFVHPDDYPASDNVGKELVDGQTVLRFENRYRHKDGSYRWLQWNAFPQPEIKTLFGIARDISAQKVAETAMRRSQMMLERTERIAQTGSWEWDVATNSTTWSAELYRFFGRDPALGAPDLAGQKTLYTPEDTQRLYAAVDKAVADGVPYELDLCSIRTTGEKRYYYALGFPERDTSGKVVRLVGSLLDITERKRAELALRASEARFSAFMQSSPVISFIKDEAGRFTYVNPTYERVFQTTLEAMQGKTVFELFPPAVAQRLHEYDAAIFASGAQAEAYEDVPTPDGMRHWLSIKFIFTNAEGARFLGGKAIDLTERKTAEKKITAQLTELRRWQSVMLDREDRVQELKREVNALLKLAGKPARYGSVES